MNTEMSTDMMPLLIPLIVLELALMIAALIHVIRHPHYRFGNRIVWIFVVLLIQFLGPIVYFTLGRGEEE